MSNNPYAELIEAVSPDACDELYLAQFDDENRMVWRGDYYFYLPESMPMFMSGTAMEAFDELARSINELFLAVGTSTQEAAQAIFSIFNPTP